MRGNTFGNYLTLTTFGESHGMAIGGVIDGMPARVAVDYTLIERMMSARRPGSGRNVSQRREADHVEILSGITPEGLTLGTPIGFIIRNTDARSSDYDNLKDVYRPNHADYTYQMKYGIRDHRGGGRASARETAVRVAAAAIVAPLLGDISVECRLIAIGGENDSSRWDEMLHQCVEEGDSIGGLAECVIKNVPTGLGEPIFGKLQSQLAAAMFSIPGVKGFEYGLGMDAANARGSETADAFVLNNDGHISTLTNFSGGIQGGITNGNDIVMRIAFKPTPTISRPLQTVDSNGNAVMLNVSGRHDPCIAVRGVAVVRAMAILTMADALLAR